MGSDAEGGRLAAHCLLQRRAPLLPSQVRGLEFNPFSSNLLVSGAADSDLTIWDLIKPTAPALYPGVQVRTAAVTCSVPASDSVSTATAGEVVPESCKNGLDSPRLAGDPGQCCKRDHAHLLEQEGAAHSCLMPHGRHDSGVGPQEEQARDQLQGPQQVRRASLRWQRCSLALACTHHKHFNSLRVRGHWVERSYTALSQGAQGGL